MIIKSFFSKDGRLQPMDVELKVMPGLPQLQVIGLPDTHLKESALRIKSALKSQGFEWPKNQQVVVNLRPSHVRKHSRGLELAIAFGILKITDQIELPWNLHDKFYVYGEVGLDGSVLQPQDLESLRSVLSDEDHILCSQDGHLVGPKILGIKDLKNLSDPLTWLQTQTPKAFSIPQLSLPHFQFSKAQAKILKVAALSEASVLLAGPPGAGKTAFAESLYHLLKPMNENEFLDLRAHHLQLGQELTGRPFVSPHHSTPVMSLIGGGSEAFPGELVKAHGGLLILDELLLFPTRVIEALREPLVSKKFQVSRRGRRVEWPADFQFVATTNLCPCGRLTKNKDFRCGYTVNRCRSTWERLSGPMLDRFDLVVLFEPYSFRHRKEEGEGLSLVEIKEQMIEARQLALEFPCSDNLEVPEVFRAFKSRRREKALKKLAWAHAVLEGKKRLDPIHWTQAHLLSQKPVEELQKLF